jgi:hypothetical protein
MTSHFPDIISIEEAKRLGEVEKLRKSLARVSDINTNIQKYNTIAQGIYDDLSNIVEKHRIIHHGGNQSIQLYRGNTETCVHILSYIENLEPGFQMYVHKINPGSTISCTLSNLYLRDPDLPRFVPQSTTKKSCVIS